MVIRVAFQQEVPPDFDLTEQAVYRDAKRFGFPEEDCIFLAKSDYENRHVINPGYEPFLDKLWKLQTTHPEALQKFVKDRQNRVTKKAAP